jgi:hypothetical protein
MAGSIRHYINVDELTSNLMFERAADSHVPAAAAQRARWTDMRRE